MTWKDFAGIAVPLGVLVLGFFIFLFMTWASKFKLRKLGYEDFFVITEGNKN